MLCREVLSVQLARAQLNPKMPAITSHIISIDRSGISYLLLMKLLLLREGRVITLLLLKLLQSSWCYARHQEHPKPNHSRLFGPRMVRKRNRMCCSNASAWRNDELGEAIFSSEACTASKSPHSRGGPRSRHPQFALNLS